MQPQNALRTVLPYKPWNELADRSVKGMLDEMHAEVVCFQEHKARRDALTKDMALPDGYDAFFSFPTLPNKSGYSGTCIYTKRSYLVPVKAEEGITGRLLGSGMSSAGAKVSYTLEERIGGYPEEGQVEWVLGEDGGGFDPSLLDVEGRAVVLDFGFFVLFNLYCPAETNATRLPYKLNYLYALSARIANLRALGRNVIVVGDLNVVHRPIDSGEGGIERRAEEMMEHPARVWLAELLAGPQGMRDVTREQWKDRKGMYTCWNTKLDARASNYGSRIDYILVTPSLLPWVAHSDIQQDIYGSDHCPVYLDLRESITGEDGKEVLLRDLLGSPTLSSQQGLAAIVDGERPDPPALATRFWDEYSGKQTSLKDFFGKKATPPKNAVVGRTASVTNGVSKGKVVVEAQRRNRERSTSANAAKVPASISGLGVRPTSNSDLSQGEQTPLDATTEMTADSTTQQASTSAPLTLAADSNETNEDIIDLTNSTETSPVKPKRKASTSMMQSKREKKPRKTAATSTEAQSNLSSFFRSPTQSLPRARVPSSATSPASAEVASRTEEEEADYQYAKALASAEEYVDEEDAGERSEAARRTWSNIFAKKVAPRCRVHNLPCKAFVTKISGKNKGKKFWLCSKPVGQGWDSGRSKRPREEVNPEYRCDFFLWDSAVKERELPPDATTGKSSSVLQSPLSSKGSPAAKRTA
ncbi:hypothetical protein QFC21_000189 [Naganishia friedmannii]|uniref:Uncharacterized protein n=1 Tax=Naganishia friedmannii TaxID=89922 RepID=A0ACC2WCG6_9TREE|nr:hypothetical protein QFC21_000189 [Naganishia friedmannii]